MQLLAQQIALYVREQIFRFGPCFIRRERANPEVGERHAHLVLMISVREARGRGEPRWPLMIGKAHTGHALECGAEQSEAGVLAAHLEGAQEPRGVSEFTQHAGTHAEIEPVTGELMWPAHTPCSTHMVRV